MATKDFSATVDAWVHETEQRLDAVCRMSVQDVINEAQTPTAKGGKIRVKTGFLRLSGTQSMSGMPSGPTRGEPKKEYPAVQVTVTKTFKVGSTLHFGWTANYAKYREAYDGFLESAVQKWPQIVADNCAKLKARVMGS